MGGTLVTPEFCDPCNREGGKVEQLLSVYPDIQERVGRYAIPNRKGKPQRPHRPVSYDDGNRGHLAFTPRGAVPTDIFARRLSKPGQVPAVYEVPEEEMETFQAGQAAKGKAVEIVGRRRATYTGGTTRYGLNETSVAIWPRFAAKVALGIISLLDLYPEWLDTEGAGKLRGLFLHDAAPGYAVGVFPSALGDHHPLTGMLEPPEHLLWLQPRPGGGSTLGMVLFGDLEFALTILELKCPPEHPTWLVQPGGPVPRREAFGAVTAGFLSRLQRRDPSSRWIAD